MKKLFSLTLLILFNTVVINAMDIELGEKEPLLTKTTIQDSAITIDNDDKDETNTKVTIIDPFAQLLFDRIKNVMSACKGSQDNEQRAYKELHKILLIKNIENKNQVISALEVFLNENIKKFSAIQISANKRMEYANKIKGIIHRNRWINGLQLLWFCVGMTGGFTTMCGKSFIWKFIGLIIIELVLVGGAAVTYMLTNSNSFELTNSNLELTNYEDAESCCGANKDHTELCKENHKNQCEIKYNEQLTRFYSIIQNIKLMPLITQQIEKIKAKSEHALDDITIPETHTLIQQDQKEIYNLLMQLHRVSTQLK